MKSAAQHFSHPALDRDLADLLAQIKNGPGLVIMRGFPVDKYDAGADAGGLLGHRHAFRARLLAKRRRRLSRPCDECREGLARLHDRPRAEPAYRLGRDRRPPLRARRQGGRAQHLCQLAEGARDHRARAPGIPAGAGARLLLRPARRGGAGGRPGDAVPGAGVLDPRRPLELPLCARRHRQGRRRARHRN